MPDLATLTARPATRRTLALAIGIVGALVFVSLEFPLPWLLGSMFACVLASLAGAPVAGPGIFAKGFRTVFGVAIGASFTPALLGRLGDMGLSLALLPLYVAAIGMAGYPFFRRVCGFDRPTAYYSAMPGGLPDMTAFGAAAGADIRVLSLVHATRVLVIVSLLPLVIHWAFGVTIAGRPMPGTALLDFDLGQLAIQTACALAGWWGANRLGISGATIVGPLIVTAALSLAGIVDGRPPVEMIVAAQLLIGISIGVRYAGASAALLMRSVGAAVGYCAILAVIAAAFTFIDVAAGLAPPIDAVLAFSPGGQAEMTVVAIVAHADVAFVALHHVTRVFLVVIGAPLVQRFLR